MICLYVCADYTRASYLKDRFKSFLFAKYHWKDIPRFISTSSSWLHSLAANTCVNRFFPPPNNDSCEVHKEIVNHRHRHSSGKLTLCCSKRLSLTCRPLFKRRCAKLHIAIYFYRQKWMTDLLKIFSCTTATAFKITELHKTKPEKQKQLS